MRYHRSLSFLLAIPLLAARTALADDGTVTNSWGVLSFHPQAAFNISATFKNIGGLVFNPAARTTPNGQLYNYNNGYVLTDVSGSAGGQTWNWGYDSASQIVGNTIQMTRSTSTLNNSISAGQEYHDASFGGELVFAHQFGVIANTRWGLQAAANYLYVSLKDATPLQGNISQVTDSYSFASGTTPPGAPYQGTFNGPGYLIGSTPSASSTTTTAVTVTGRRDFTAHVFGFHVGPYVELPVLDHIDLSLSAGLATAAVYGSGNWNETVTLGGSGPVSSSGSGQNVDMVYGGYANAGLSWQFSKRWSLEAGAQYQNLGFYNHTFGGRGIELDLHHYIVVSLGVGCRF